MAGRSPAVNKVRASMLARHVVVEDWGKVTDGLRPSEATPN
jgi:hypothetical protein